MGYRGGSIYRSTRRSGLSRLINPTFNPLPTFMPVHDDDVKEDSISLLPRKTSDQDGYDDDDEDAPTSYRFETVDGSFPDNEREDYQPYLRSKRSRRLLNVVLGFIYGFIGFVAGVSLLSRKTSVDIGTITRTPSPEYASTTMIHFDNMMLDVHNMSQWLGGAPADSFRGAWT